MSEAPPNLLDPETFVPGVPHEHFAWLRNHDPLSWHPGRPGRELAGRRELDQRGFWVVVRHADVVTLSKDAATYSSERGTALNADMAEQDLLIFRQQLVHMDAPRHTKLRNLVNRGFTPRRARDAEPRMRELAREIVDQVAARGSCDFVTEVAAELPLLVLADLLGVPRADRGKLFDWSNRMIGLEDPEFGDPLDAQAALLELIQYFSQLGAKRRTDPTEDLTSVLVHAEVEGENLTPTELNMFFFLLVIAGNETTRNAISGGMQALCEHPDQYARLRADRSLLPTAMDEIVRWVSPVMQFRRTATRDVELHGKQVAENDKLVMYYGAANRDDRAFAGADRFDVGRSPNPHLGFGIGNHFCLGAAFARLEMRCMFDELLGRLPDLELAGPPERLRSNFINGIKHLPVRFTPSS